MTAAEIRQIKFILTAIETFGYVVIIVGVLSTIVTTITIAIRLFGKLVAKARFGADDWLIIVAQVLKYLQLAVQIWGTSIAQT